MAEIALPQISRHKALRGIIVDRHDVAGAALFAVTSHIGSGRSKRRWFASREIALAHAADRADEHSLALLDLTDPVEER